VTLHYVPDVRSLRRGSVQILPSAVSEFRPATKIVRADDASESG
jgi:hypothetical protein